MRIDLRVPFAEKDAVKALGGRWDGAKRVWYVVNAADLAPFSRWLPTGADVAEKIGISTGERATPQAKASSAVVTRAPRGSDICTCDVLPWEDCAHTLPAHH